MWSNGMTSPRISDLNSGQYILDVADRFNCNYSTPSFLLRNPDLLELEIEITGTTADKNEGEISLTPKGGKTPYQVTWDPRITEYTQFRALNLAAGVYQVQLEDSVSCKLDTMVIIPVIQSIKTLGEIVKEYALYPIPTDNTLHLFMKNSEPMCFDLGIVDMRGNRVMSLGQIPCLLEFDQSWDLANDLVSGRYFLLIRHRDGWQSALPFQVR